MGGGGSMHRGDMTIRLVPRAERERNNGEIAMALRRQLAGLPGVIIRARPSGGNWQLNRILGGGSDSRLALEIRGYDLDEARRLAEAAQSLMRNTPGIADVRIGREEGRPELAVRVDRDKAALLGLTVSGVAEHDSHQPGGHTGRLLPRARLRISDHRPSPSGGSRPHQRRQHAPHQHPGRPGRRGQEPHGDRERIGAGRSGAEEPGTHHPRQRRDRNRNVDERGGGGGAGAASRTAHEPRDFSVGFGAEVEEQAKAFRQLQLLLVLAIVLVYAVMAAQYESLRDPFIIMFSIPLAAVGVVLALKLTNTPFSMQAYIGVIMLAGIVVSNAILLVDYTNTLRRRDGMPLREAVEIAGRTRLRPIIMTTLCTILGLVPMAIGHR